jgi:hypothetical protein
MKRSLTLEKVISEVKQFDLSRRLPKSFQNPLKGAVGPSTLQEVDLPSTEPKEPLDVRRQALSDEIDQVLKSQHPLRRFWRVKLRSWLVSIFWIE